MGQSLGAVVRAPQASRARFNGYWASGLKIAALGGEKQPQGCVPALARCPASRPGTAPWPRLPLGLFFRHQMSLYHCSLVLVRPADLLAHGASRPFEVTIMNPRGPGSQARLSNCDRNNRRTASRREPGAGPGRPSRQKPDPRLRPSPSPLTKRPGPAGPLSSISVRRERPTRHRRC